MAGKEIRIKSALPYYITGLVWVLYALFLRLYRLSDLLLCAAVSLLAYLLVSRFAPVKVWVIEEVDFEKSGDEYGDEIVSQGEEMLKTLYALHNEIDSEDLRQIVWDLYGTGEKIYGYISQNPKKASLIRKFNLYYFPETLKILKTYANFHTYDGRSQSAEEMKEKIEKTVHHMGTVFRKQLDLLLHEEAYDIQNDIEVLEAILAEETGA